jgi:hypothetical protein
MRSADYKLIGGIPPFPSLLYADAVAWYNLAKLSYKVCSPRYLVACKIHEENVHHKSDLYKHYEAAKSFLTFLQETDYFREQGPAAAVKFVQGRYTRVIHRTLLALMGTPGNRAVGEYRAVKKQVMAQAASDGAFEVVLDVKARLYELLASLPLPFFRRVLWRLLTGMSRVRIRDRRKEPPTRPRSSPEEGA